MYLWVKTILKSPSATRKKLKAAVLEGLRVYNAKWKKDGENPYFNSENGANLKGPIKWKLQSLDFNSKNSANLMGILEGPTKWKLQSLDPKVKEFHDDLKKEKGVQYVGIVPWVDYIMESGSQERLNAIWNHELGSAGLMYKINGLPAVIIVNPDMDLHDSTANKIPGNTVERMMGLGG